MRFMAAFLAVSALVLGKEADETVEDSGFVIRTEANLAVVPLHACRNKSSVNGLGKESFELHEDSVKQNIAFVEGPAGEGEPAEAGRTVPTEIIFLIDFSRSVMMKDLLDFTSI